MPDIHAGNVFLYGSYIEAYYIDRVAKSVLRVAPVSVFQYGSYIRTHSTNDTSGSRVS